MLNPDLKLKSNIFENPDQAATRDGFGQALLELGASNPDVVVLSADLSESTRTLAFKEKYPERFIEIGVAEQNLAAVASGLANYGKIPFIASYAAFSPGRNNEQIRTTVALNNVPVKIAGMHAGLSVGPDGATHQALEDLALMRVLPNMTVISPCDSEEARKATLAAAKHRGPVYLRFAREKSPTITTVDTPFEIGKVNVIWKFEPTNQNLKSAVALFATGPLLYEALLAAKKLAQEEISVTLINVATIKPLDESIVQIAGACGSAVTIEEHQTMGGLGSAIAELLARTTPLPIEFIGVHDRFGQSGEPPELYREYGMDAEAIIAAAKKVIKRKM